MPMPVSAHGELHAAVRHHAVVVDEADVDVDASVRGELQRVVDQVGEDLADPGAVSDDGLRYPRIHLPVERDSLFCRAWQP